MKKAFSVIFNILTYVSASIFLILAGFCVYDWIRISRTVFADSYEFWLVIDYYAKGMTGFSIASGVFSLANFLLNLKEPINTKIKKRSVIFAVISAICVIVSVILYFLPFEF